MISGIKSSTSDSVSAVNNGDVADAGIIAYAIGPVIAQRMVKTSPHVAIASAPPVIPSRCHRIVNAYNAPTMWRW